MKIFKFDPATGKKGDFICSLSCISWTDTSLSYAVKNNHFEPIEHTKPVNNAFNEWTVHVNAGDKGSYLTGEWICFCQGQLDDVWTWIILPPKQLLKKV